MGDDGLKSAFNEGAFQMQRINDLQTRLNVLNVKPLAYDTIAHQYNFETMVTTLNSLLSEASSKMKDTELDEAKRYKNIIEWLIENKNPFETIIIGGYESPKKAMKLNKENWATLKKLIFSYELKIREYLEEHNLTSPKEELYPGW